MFIASSIAVVAASASSVRPWRVIERGQRDVRAAVLRKGAQLAGQRHFRLCEPIEVNQRLGAVVVKIQSCGRVDAAVSSTACSSEYSASA